MDIQMNITFCLPQSSGWMVIQGQLKMNDKCNHLKLRTLHKRFTIWNYGTANI